MPKVTPFLAGPVLSQRAMKAMLRMIDKINIGGLNRAYAGE